MSDAEDVERGRLADSVLNNRVYAESYDLIERELIRIWQESRNKDEREELHQLQRMLSKVRTLLESTMRSGKIAAAELERKRSLPERLGIRRGQS